ncbi:pentapeptide repeat-containing protein [Arthrobacter sp. Br18]|uniref:pentapeptide repeat-containing protein n=1 Tax=Arthrobacter sp. Br18 TaxID=1312954 RepID=UPI0004B0688A|nr:pentapeptide repeat-containing protein [Arthrobacter sp. Br18]
MANSMAKKKTKAPRFDRVAPTNLTAGDADGLRSGDHREGELYERAGLDDQDLTGITFLECSLAAASMNNTELRGARFLECSFTELFAPVFRASRSTWRDVVLDGTRWGSAELYDGVFEFVRINGGKLDFVNFRSSKLSDVVISHCMIGELDLTGVTGSRIAFVNCRIGTLTLSDSRLSDVDLRTSDFRTINGMEGLRGVTIDEYQLSLIAPYLADSLGITVEN